MPLRRLEAPHWPLRTSLDWPNTRSMRPCCAAVSRLAGSPGVPCRRPSSKATLKASWPKPKPAMGDCQQRQNLQPRRLPLMTLRTNHWAARSGEVDDDHRFTFHPSAHPSRRCSSHCSQPWPYTPEPSRTASKHGSRLSRLVVAPGVTTPIPMKGGCHDIIISGRSPGTAAVG